MVSQAYIVVNHMIQNIINANSIPKINFLRLLTLFYYVDVWVIIIVAGVAELWAMSLGAEIWSISLKGSSLKFAVT